MDGRELLERMPGRWRALAERVCGRLHGAGHQGWLVGGAVRDLVLGRPLKDVDLVTDARPEVVEALFERTVAVGRAFGIIVVVEGGEEVEVATFRRERGYSDRRRPDEVVFTNRPEEDAGRRDFTCNALYLDPRSGALRDPAGGLDDLRNGQLRAVGDAGGRFREDGLRILRMARFLAALDLEPAPGLLEAARQEGAALEGVSPERVRAELHRMLTGPRPVRALEVLVEGGHAARTLPGLERREVASARLSLLRDVESAGALPSPEVAWSLGLAALFGSESAGEADGGDVAGSLEALRCSRSEVRAVTELEAFSAAWTRRARSGEPAVDDAEGRGELVELWRRAVRPQGVVLAEARARRDGDEATLALARLAEAAAAASLAASESPIELSAGELLELGVERGPALGAMLLRVRCASLGGAFSTEEAARAWVEERLR